MPVTKRKTRTEQIRSIGYLRGTFSQVQNAVRNIDYEPVLKSFIPKLEEFHSILFLTGTSPSGERMKKLAPSTVRKKGHGRILIEKGELGSSLAGKTGSSIRETTHRGLIFGTSDEKSILHTMGSKSWTKLPIREHVGMDDMLIDDLASDIADATVEAMKL